MDKLVVMVLITAGLIIMGILGFIFGLRAGIKEGMYVTETTYLKAAGNLGLKETIVKEIGNL